MGTGNFYVKNTDAVYLIEPYPEADYYMESYLEILENAQYVFEEKIKELKNMSGKDLSYIEQDTSEFVQTNNWRTDRSFPARKICSIVHSFMWHETEQRIEALIVSRAGYYENANLDFEMEIIPMYDFSSDGFRLEDFNEENEREYIENLIAGSIDLYKEDFEEKFPEFEQNKHEYEADLYNKLYEQSFWLAGEINKIFPEISEKYNVVARFSNGETIYEKAA